MNSWESSMGYGFMILMLILGGVYLGWVVLAWALIVVVTALGGTVGVSAWVLAIPLLLVVGLAKRVVLK